MLMDVTRTIDKAYVSSTSAAAGYYGYVFQLNDIADVSSFTSVFDQYRINKIEFSILPVSQPQLPGASSSWSILYGAIDYDDGTAPTSVSEVTSYNNCFVVEPGRRRSFAFTPKWSGGAYNGSVVAGAPQTGWLDCAYSSVQHYGLKIAVIQSTSTNVNTWYVVCKYHVSFKNSR